jgi:hypothetical protein
MQHHIARAAYDADRSTTPTGGIPGQLHKEIDKKVQEFYADEASISEWDKSRLCAPSGEEDAELVVIRHCRTRNGALPVGAFWDMTAFTIQTLAAKGYSTDFLYGYDWHWRAEETCIGRGNCSAAKWPQAVKRVERVPKTAPKTAVFCTIFTGT